MRHPVCLGYQVATPEVVVSPTATALSGPLDQSLAVLAETGYDAVELITVDPARLDQGMVRDLVRRHGLRVVNVCTGDVYGKLGLSLTDPDPSRRLACVMRLCQIVDFASYLGSNVNIGRARGFLGDDPVVHHDLMVAGLRALCDHAADCGVDVFLEPIERAETDNVHTVADGEALVGEAARENLATMMDTCAMVLEEADLYACAAELGGRVRYVHLTEVERSYPGSTGSVDFRDFVERLAQAGYVGPFSIEVEQRPDPRTAVERSFACVAPILRDIYGWEGRLA